MPRRGAPIINGEKVCKDCQQSLSVDRFPQRKQSTDGLHWLCLDCKRAQGREWGRAYNARHPEARRQSAVRYQRANAEKASKTIREKKYKMTLEQIERMIIEQGDACKLCRGELGDTWTVDHDHACCPKAYTCGQCIRGVLCRRCNIALGMFREDPELLIAASIYVTQRSDALALASMLDQPVTQ